MYSASTLGMHQMSLCQGLDGFGQASADCLTRETVMVGQLDHRASQQLQRPAGAAFGRLEQAVATRRASSLLVSLRGARAAFRSGGFEIDFNEATSVRKRPSRRQPKQRQYRRR